MRNSNIFNVQRQKRVTILLFRKGLGSIKVDFLANWKLVVHPMNLGFK